MMRHLAIALLACGPFTLAVAQVRVDRPIVLDGPTDADRQVMGLAPWSAPGELLNAAGEQAGTHRFATAVPGAVWTVQLPALADAPQAGTHLRSPSRPTRAPRPAFRERPWPYAMLLPDGTAPDSTLLLEGTLLSLVFDGTDFQVMNGPVHARRNCPDDMQAVTESYCIDRNEQAVLNFYDAAMACGVQGRRLCSWGEFHAACEDRVALGLNGMVNNWEWTNSSADSNFNVRTAGLNDCQANQRINGLSNTRNFRCCLTR